MAKKNINANLVQKKSANGKNVLAEGGDGKYV